MANDPDVIYADDPSSDLGAAPPPVVPKQGSRRYIKPVRTMVPDDVEPSMMEKGVHWQKRLRPTVVENEDGSTAISDMREDMAVWLDKSKGFGGSPGWYYNTRGVWTPAPSVPPRYMSALGSVAEYAKDFGRNVKAGADMTAQGLSDTALLAAKKAGAISQEDYDKAMRQSEVNAAYAQNLMDRGTGPAQALTRSLLDYGAGAGLMKGAMHGLGWIGKLAARAPVKSLANLGQDALAASKGIPTGGMGSRDLAARGLEMETRPGFIRAMEAPAGLAPDGTFLSRMGKGAMEGAALGYLTAPGTEEEKTGAAMMAGVASPVLMGASEGGGAILRRAKGAWKGKSLGLRPTAEEIGALREGRTPYAADIEVEANKLGITPRTSDLMPGETPGQRLIRDIDVTAQHHAGYMSDAGNVNMEKVGRAAERMASDVSGSAKKMAHQGEAIVARYAAEGDRDAARVASIIEGAKDAGNPGVVRASLTTSEFVNHKNNEKLFNMAMTSAPEVVYSMDAPIRTLETLKTRYEGLLPTAKKGSEYGIINSLLDDLQGVRAQARAPIEANVRNATPDPYTGRVAEQWVDTGVRGGDVGANDLGQVGARAVVGGRPVELPMKGMDAGTPQGLQANRAWALSMARDADNPREAKVFGDLAESFERGLTELAERHADTHPGFLSALRTAREDFKKNVLPYRDNPITQMMESNFSDEAISGLSRGGDKVARAKQSFNLLDPKGQEAFRGSLLEEAVRRADDGKGHIDAGKISRFLTKDFGGATGVFFGGTQHADRLKGLIKVANALEGGNYGRGLREQRLSTHALWRSNVYGLLSQAINTDWGKRFLTAAGKSRDQGTLMNLVRKYAPMVVAVEGTRSPADAVFANTPDVEVYEDPSQQPQESAPAATPVEQDVIYADEPM